MDRPQRPGHPGALHSGRYLSTTLRPKAPRLIWSVAAQLSRYRSLEVVEHVGQPRVDALVAPPLGDEHAGKAKPEAGRRQAHPVTEPRAPRGNRTVWLRRSPAGDHVRSAAGRRALRGFEYETFGGPGLSLYEPAYAATGPGRSACRLTSHRDVE